jgi:hypothetical protein
MPTTSDSPDPAPRDLLTLQEAADELLVEPEQIRAMVADDLLVPAGEDAGVPVFHRAAVEAVRLAGG